MLGCCCSNGDEDGTQLLAVVVQKAVVDNMVKLEEDEEPSNAEEDEEARNAWRSSPPQIVGRSREGPALVWRTLRPTLPRGGGNSSQGSDCTSSTASSAPLSRKCAEATLADEENTRKKSVGVVLNLSTASMSRMFTESTFIVEENPPKKAFTFPNNTLAAASVAASSALMSRKFTESTLADLTPTFMHSTHMAASVEVGSVSLRLTGSLEFSCGGGLKHLKEGDGPQEEEEGPRTPEGEPEGELVGDPSACEPPRGRVFEVSIMKDGPLGLVLDLKHSVLSVARVDDGCVEAYNAKADQDSRLATHDYIVDINGQTSKSSMLAELEECKGTVKLKVVRPEPWVVKLVRKGKPFGAGVAYADDGVSVDFEEISAGAVQDFNLGAQPADQLRVGDSIIKVNSIAGAPTEMVYAMMTKRMVELTCVRPPPTS